MSKEDVIASLNSIENTLNQIGKLVNGVKGTVISRNDIRNQTRTTATKWFEAVDKSLTVFGVHEQTAAKYHLLFDKLLKLSLKTSWRSTYVKTVSDILKDYRMDLMAPVLKSVAGTSSIKSLDKILENVSDEEKEYLVEAINCANHEYLRASIVLGWCASVHRMHKVVEKLGFDEFNKKTQEMKVKTEGRFKKFKKVFDVHSLSELGASVFDNDLLWVLEYWELIDANQHDRLSLCFTMRNNCAHPGEAPLTLENLASFYSDIKNIIFDNPKFNL